MPTLILSPIYSPNSRRLREAAEQAGWRTLRLLDWTAPEDVAVEHAVVWGELKLGRIVATGTPLALYGPTVGWTAELPLSLRQREIEVSTVGAVRLAGGPRFIKPIFEKTFLSRVYDQGRGHGASDELDDRLPVEVCEPVEWDVEYRCFVRDRRVATMAPSYRRGRPLAAAEGPWPPIGPEADEANVFVQRVLADATVALPPAVVLDVGLIAGRVWAVVEASEAWASALYGCKERGVLDVLRGACVPLDAVAPEHRRRVHPFPLGGPPP